MKKLMLTFMAVTVGTMVNAASYQWSCSSSFFDGTGTTTKMTDGTSVYLMFTSDYSQSDLVSDFAKNSVATSKALSSSAIASGKITGGTASYETTDSQTAYLAVIYGDRLFVSSTTEASYTAVGSSDIAFDSQAYLTRYNNTVNTLKADNLASAGYVGAGWYNVPEPTSVMLLLLGFAGLALKRKNA